MSGYKFPSEIPEVGVLIRVTPVKIDYIVKHYRDFCLEAYVVGRFLPVNYEGKECLIEVFTNNCYISKLFYNKNKKYWTAFFDEMEIQVEVEIKL